MTASEVVQRFRNVNMYSRGRIRAPHKAFVVLYALARLQRGEPRLMSYDEVEKPLVRLLSTWGTRGHRFRKPCHPFVRLANDGVWEIKSLDPIAIDTKRTWTGRQLRDRRIVGGFTAGIHRALTNDRELVKDIALFMLRQVFPPTLHEGILDDVGLTVGPVSDALIGNSVFSERVLKAYGRRCAICGFSCRFNNMVVGVSATHIRWREAGGLDEEVNGLALCALHRQLFDNGVITVDESYKVRIATSALQGKASQQLQQYEGEEITLPLDPRAYPDRLLLRWHSRWVFRGTLIEVSERSDSSDAACDR